MRARRVALFLAFSLVMFLPSFVNLLPIANFVPISQAEIPQSQPVLNNSLGYIVATSPNLQLVASRLNLHFNPQVGLLAVGSQAGNATGWHQYLTDNNFVIAYALTGVNDTMKNQILTTLNANPAWSYYNCRKEGLMNVPVAQISTQNTLQNFTAIAGSFVVQEDNYCLGTPLNEAQIAQQFSTSLWQTFNAWNRANVTGAKYWLNQSASFWNSTAQGFVTSKSQKTSVYQTRDLGYYMFATELIGYVPPTGPTQAQITSDVTALEAANGAFSNGYSVIPPTTPPATATDIETFTSVLVAFNPAFLGLSKSTVNKISPSNLFLPLKFQYPSGIGCSQIQTANYYFTTLGAFAYFNSVSNFSGGILLAKWGSVPFNMPLNTGGAIYKNASIISYHFSGTAFLTNTYNIWMTFKLLPGSCGYYAPNLKVIINGTLSAPGNLSLVFTNKNNQRVSTSTSTSNYSLIFGNVGFDYSDSLAYNPRILNQTVGPLSIYSLVYSVGTSFIIDPTTLDTTTTQTATQDSDQQKVIYCNGRTYAAWSDGANIDAINGSGATMSSPSPVTTLTSSVTSSNGQNFAWFSNGSPGFIVYALSAASGANQAFFRYRYGTCGANGVVTWSIAESTNTIASTKVVTQIAVFGTSSTNIWVALRTNSATNDMLEVWKYNGTWFGLQDRTDGAVGNKIGIMIANLTTGPAIVYEGSGSGATTQVVNITYANNYASANSWTTVQPNGIGFYVVMNSSIVSLGNSFIMVGESAGSTGQSSGKLTEFLWNYGANGLLVEHTINSTSLAYVPSLSLTVSSGVYELVAWEGVHNSLSYQRSIDNGTTWSTNTNLINDESGISGVTATENSGTATSGVIYTSGTSTLHVNFTTVTPTVGTLVKLTLSPSSTISDSTDFYSGNSFSVTYTEVGQSKSASFGSSSTQTLTVDPSTTVTIPATSTGTGTCGLGQQITSCLGVFNLAQTTTTFSSPASGTQTTTYVFYTVTSLASFTYAVTGGGSPTAPVFTYFSAPSSSGSSDSPTQYTLTLSLSSKTVNNITDGKTWTVTNPTTGSTTSERWATPVFSGTMNFGTTSSPSSSGSAPSTNCLGLENPTNCVPTIFTYYHQYSITYQTGCGTCTLSGIVNGSGVTNSGSLWMDAQKSQTINGIGTFTSYPDNAWWINQVAGTSCNGCLFVTNASVSSFAQNPSNTQFTCTKCNVTESIPGSASLSPKQFLSNGVVTSYTFTNQIFNGLGAGPNQELDYLCTNNCNIGGGNQNGGGGGGGGGGLNIITTVTTTYTSNNQTFTSTFTYNTTGYDLTNPGVGIVIILVLISGAVIYSRKKDTGPHIARKSFSGGSISRNRSSGATIKRHNFSGGTIKRSNFSGSKIERQNFQDKNSKIKKRRWQS